MSATAIGTVPTENGSRYLQQLCKHWAHKFEVSFDKEKGTVDINGTMLTMVAAPDTLTVTVEAPNEETLPKMQDVVAKHLDRFAFREAPLPFVWS